MSAPARATPFADISVNQTSQFLDSGPVLFLTTRNAGMDNVMALGWHRVAGHSPALVSCVVAAQSLSHELLRESGACALNVPTAEMLDALVRVGNCSGARVDKFAAFGLAKAQGEMLDVPVLPQCHAIMECLVHDDAAARRHNLFVLEVIRLKARPQPTNPKYVHYIGNGEFRTDGRRVSRRAMFRPDLLGQRTKGPWARGAGPAFRNPLYSSSSISQ